MVKIFKSYWDMFYGRNPGAFHRDARKSIKLNALEFLKKFGKNDWVKTEDIFEGTIKDTDFFNTEKGKMFFAEQGIRSRINGAIGSLRREGYPIIAGVQSWKGKIKGYVGRGYRYADWDCEDVADVWNEKRTALEQRKTNTEKEKLRDIGLIKEIIERLLARNKLQEAKQLQEVLVEYQK